MNRGALDTTIKIEHSGPKTAYVYTTSYYPARTYSFVYITTIRMSIAKNLLIWKKTKANDPHRKEEVIR